MLTNKVLLATDFSNTAEKLMDCLQELKGLGAKEVVLVHVVDIHSAKLDAGQLQTENEKKLKEVKKHIQEMGFEVEIRVPIGSPSAEINKIAEKEDVSLILIASHGRGFIKKIFMGSTAYDVIRKAQKPILVEKYKNLESDACEVACKNKFSRIMVPTDFSECAGEVVEMLKKLNTPAQEVILTSVIESSSSLQELENNKKAAEEKMMELKNELDQNDVSNKITIKVEEGVASDNIIRIAEEEDIGIIMMSTHGQGGLKDLLIGSTADRVARKSPIPVLLVPCNDKK